MIFHRVAKLPARAGGGSALRSDEIDRHAARLVVIDRVGTTIVPFAELPRVLRAGDLVVVNDAATLPAALPGLTANHAQFELRMLAPPDGSRIYGVLFGEGDHHTRTEDRAAPPPIEVGDRVCLGTIDAVVVSRHGRRVELVASRDRDALWQALYAAGKPVQYAHRSELVPLWSVQTAYAARPWAVEMPSAGRPLTWDVLLGLRRAGISIATLTHAAGLSSTGDDALDRALPWPERYEIPQRTVTALAAAKARGGRVIAIGTTVVRALESAAPEVRAGSGIATLRLDAAYRPQVVDGLVSGLHSPGESHFDLLSAFAPPDRLRRAIELAAVQGLSGHELGDACLVL